MEVPIKKAIRITTRMAFLLNTEPARGKFETEQKKKIASAQFDISSAANGIFDRACFQETPNIDC